MRRRFKNPEHQKLYDALRSNPPADLERSRQEGAAMNCYVVGLTLPNEPPRIANRGSRAYAAWAAGVDNAKHGRLADQ